MVNTADLYKSNKVGLANLLYDLYINTPDVFINIVNNELNNWDRFNIVNLFRINKPITHNDILNALLA